MYSMSSVCVYFEFMYIRSAVNSYDFVCSCCTDKSVFRVSVSQAIIFSSHGVFHDPRFCSVRWHGDDSFSIGDRIWTWHLHERTIFVAVKM